MTITGLIDPEVLFCPFYYTYSERQCFLNCTGSTRAKWDGGRQTIDKYFSALL